MRKVVIATEEIVHRVVIENKYLVGEEEHEELLHHCHWSPSSECAGFSGHGGGSQRTR